MTSDSQLFSLDPRLQKDTQLIGDLPLCRVLLMKDARFPWMILVPRRSQVSEIWELSTQDQSALVGEVSHSAKGLKSLTGAQKVNVGALGNIVRQLHFHIVGRFAHDVAWPRPVWSYGGAVGYDEPTESLWVRLLKEQVIGTFGP